LASLTGLATIPRPTPFELMSTSTSHLLAVARGDSPADLLLKNCKIVNVFTGEIEESDVAIAGDRIAGIGTAYAGKETIDLNGSYVAPGLIDAHVHIESSLCTSPNFAAAVVPRGVTTVIADPHEIANVCGAAGVRYMAEASKGLPLRVVLMAPSCVPATPMATAGANLSAEDLATLLREGVVHGLAEVMNFPGAIAGSSDVMAKIGAFAGRPIDGHAPGVTGKALNAYAAAGINSDHESVSAAEAKEQLARGMYLLIREATNACNLDTLLAVVTKSNSRRVCFCTDDRTPADLLGPGGIDDMVRRAIAFGIEPVEAIRMATLNTAECFGLSDRGGIAPGRFADLFVFDDLKSPRATKVYVSGRVATFGATKPSVPIGNFRISPRDIDLNVPAKGSTIRVIGSLTDQLITTELHEAAKVLDGMAVPDVARDILKIAVVERHRGSGNIGVGFIRGFRLKRGAIAGTVAHDHHNLVVIGCDDRSMHTAIDAVAKMAGGLVVVDGASVVASLSLPVAGLMSDRPIAEVRDAYEKLLASAHALGAGHRDPFMAMSFMALEVIPKLKLTDQGLVDVEKFDFVSLFVAG
jgi:adenine deaminase